jgi:hypothetical protein
LVLVPPELLFAGNLFLQLNIPDTKRHLPTLHMPARY